MKPRTKKQFEIVRLSTYLSAVNDELLRWSFDVCNEHIGIANKTNFWCIDCGNDYPIDLVKNDKAFCPNCSRELNITKSLKRKYEQSYYVAYAEVVKGYQVIRLFEVCYYHKKGYKPRCYIQENIQQYIDIGKNDVYYIARACNTGTSYPTCGNLEIRDPKRGQYYYNERKYNPIPYKYHPNSEFLDDCVKKGVSHKMQSISFLDLIRKYNLSQVETLLKQGHYPLVKYSIYEYSLIVRFWSSIKIALRNNYKVEDYSTWFDYLQLLKFFNKDLHNPYYICPKDLKQAHDFYVQKKRKHDAEMEVKRKIEKSLKDKKIFEELKSKFFGIQFSKGNILVKVIDTIEDYLNEGAELNHCIFTNSYHTKENSLCLSAIVDGKRTETVEISLNNFEIIQCRGYRNQNSEYHNQIISLVKENIHLIQAKCTSIKPKAKKKKLQKAAA